MCCSMLSSPSCLCIQVVRALTDLKSIVSKGDDLSLRRAITYFLNNIAKQTQEQETIAAIGEDMFAVALDQPFRYNLVVAHQLNFPVVMNSTTLYI